MIARIAFLLGFATAALLADDPPDYYGEEVGRFTRFTLQESPRDRLRGVQGLSDMKHWPSEERLVSLLADPSPEVRREAVLALGRIGGAKSIPCLASLARDPSWEIRRNAELALLEITGGNPRASEAELLNQLERNDFLPSEREGKVRALSRLASPKSEKRILRLLSQNANPRLNGRERSFLCEALERIGTKESIAILAGEKSDPAAYALGAIGGPEAEKALLAFPKTFAVMLNLDRLGSTNGHLFLRQLIYSFGLLTYRGHPEDLNLPDAQPIQRVAANLIIRSGLGPMLVDATLRELEQTMNPPLRTGGIQTAAPPELLSVLKAMRDELKPGFVRGDGLTTSQPLAAAYHVISDTALVPRLGPLLRHPAYLPRIYVAMMLGKLRAGEAVPDLLALIREGYPFSDATALASGKHFEHSQTIRWRGFLCMALGKIGTEQARIALENLATDPSQPRDVRYGAVVGLGFMMHPLSANALRQAAEKDLIWMIRDEAGRVLENLGANPNQKLELARDAK